ncbi:transposase [Phormidesmis priestleyi]
MRQNDGKKGEVYGFDGGKLIKGRKRFILVDTLGLLMAVVVINANCSERHQSAKPRPRCQKSSKATLVCELRHLMCECTFS